jgi:hypothetical protein
MEAESSFLPGLSSREMSGARRRAQGRNLGDLGGSGGVGRCEVESEELVAGWRCKSVRQKKSPDQERLWEDMREESASEEELRKKKRQHNGREIHTIELIDKIE